MRIVCILLSVYFYVLIARAIFSYFRRLPEGLVPVARVVHAMTEPVLRVFRPMIPPVRVGAVALDVSFMLVFFLLLILRGAICSSVVGF